MKPSELIANAMNLSAKERAIVADSLLKSLDPPEAIVDKQWLALAKQRLSQVRSGVEQTVVGEDVFKKIQERFKT